MCIKEVCIHWSTRWCVLWFIHSFTYLSTHCSIYSVNYPSGYTHISLSQRKAPMRGRGLERNPQIREMVKINQNKIGAGRGAYSQWLTGNYKPAMLPNWPLRIFRSQSVWDVPNPIWYQWFDLLIIKLQIPFHLASKSKQPFGIIFMGLGMQYKLKILCLRVLLAWPYYNLYWSILMYSSIMKL